MSDYSPPPRLRSEVWIQAQVRICNAASLPVTIARRGDPDAGAILIKIYRGRENCVVYGQALSMDGSRGWMMATGASPVLEADADAYIQRQRARDGDLWILEIEDLKGHYVLEDIIKE